ncbi:hypothetical protein [Spirosoma endophyticum]|uniref:Por secretion system C-terminal sorting domain-containing protein n=1 Tax=Spirosoma endophyticum TaxID=662367 RepID=A0A1I1MRV8_9BACT|nr:hypothetical protein [Spirosoma endophyticum]SFC88157.1 hypothetical protein SAMN05216167_102688 [Spirosoma endophyticum]
MSPLVLFILLSISLGPANPQPRKKNRPTELAHYQTGVYLAAQGTKLRVNIDKQLGGSVSIQFVDKRGNVYFDKTLEPSETMARISMDITDLADGYYSLKISNGLEMEVRTISITTPRPTTVSRSITVL